MNVKIRPKIIPLTNQRPPQPRHCTVQDPIRQMLLLSARSRERVRVTDDDTIPLLPHVAPLIRRDPVIFAIHDYSLSDYEYRFREYFAEGGLGDDLVLVVVEVEGRCSIRDLEAYACRAGCRGG